MPEQPVNRPLSSKEAVQSAFHQVERYLADGICESCALKLVCNEHSINYGRFVVLWLDRGFDE